MSLGTRSKGTRLYHAAANASWTDLAAGVAPGNAWTEFACPIGVSNVKRYETVPYDASCMSDAAEQPAFEKKPGGFSFELKQKSETPTVKDLADAATERMFAILYVDGQAFVIKGKLIADTEGGGGNSLTEEVKHGYRVAGTAIGEWKPTAT